MKVLNMRNITFNPATMLYIGRGPGACHMMNTPIWEKGWLGNPVSIGKVCPVCGEIHRDGGSTLPCHKKMLFERMRDPDFLSAIRVCARAGKDLVCWCAPKPCHGNTLAALFKTIEDRRQIS